MLVILVFIMCKRRYFLQKLQICTCLKLYFQEYLVLVEQAQNEEKDEAVGYCE